MTSLAVIIVALCTIQLLAVQNLIAASETIINPVIIPGDGPGSCATAESRQDAIASIETAVKMNIADVVLVSECGDGLWYSAARLDMTDPRQQCPTGWREYNVSSIRACGRPETEISSCANIISYTTGSQYSKVCGRVIGYQSITPDGFIVGDRTIDENYVDGISITYGENPRQHIWTYAAGVTEKSTDYRPNNCPCSDQGSTQPQGFVSDRYYCESGNIASDDTDNVDDFYGNDRLWDGQQCSNEGACCTTMSPPWFRVDLAESTT
jgi:hypothetical protein